MKKVVFLLKTFCLIGVFTFIIPLETQAIDLKDRPEDSFEDTEEIFITATPCQILVNEASCKITNLKLRGKLTGSYDLYNYTNETTQKKAFIKPKYSYKVLGVTDVVVGYGSTKFAVRKTGNFLDQAFITLDATCVKDTVWENGKCVAIPDKRSILLEILNGLIVTLEDMQKQLAERRANIKKIDSINRVVKKISAVRDYRQANVKVSVLYSDASSYEFLLFTPNSKLAKTANKEQVKSALVTKLELSDSEVDKALSFYILDKPSFPIAAFINISLTDEVTGTFLLEGNNLTDPYKVPADIVWSSKIKYENKQVKLSDIKEIVVSDARSDRPVDPVFIKYIRSAVADNFLVGESDVPDFPVTYVVEEPVIESYGS